MPRLALVALVAVLVLPVADAAASVEADSAGRARLRVLATGDSNIQIVDYYLRDAVRRRGGRFVSDAHISTGVSSLGLFNWLGYAARQSRVFAPHATVMFIGGNDGWPMRHRGRLVYCCKAAWTAAYQRRVRRMMASYMRRGRGRVYWMTLPAPAPRRFRAPYRAVNRAVRRAAATAPKRVRVVDIAKVFTPRGYFQGSIRWRGRRVWVRQGDGVHLNSAGASIAAQLVVRAMRRDRVLRR